MEKKLKRSKNDKWLTGLCGGIAEFFGIKSWIVRLVVFLCAATLLGVIVYFVVSYYIPEDGNNIYVESHDADNN